ncbi:MAG TPA: hypothetical protein VFX41_03085, partial [Actinomycetales bacterium]|nr:hypothetical protein [Actinomycetales bacterium]
MAGEVMRHNGVRVRAVPTGPLEIDGEQLLLPSHTEARVETTDSEVRLPTHHCRACHEPEHARADAWDRAERRVPHQPADRVELSTGLHHQTTGQ